MDAIKIQMVINLKIDPEDWVYDFGVEDDKVAEDTITYHTHRFHEFIEHIGVSEIISIEGTEVR